MNGFLRAGGFAAAATILAALFVTPAAAAEAQAAPLPVQTASIGAIPSNFSLSPQPQATTAVATPSTLVTVAPPAPLLPGQMAAKPRPLRDLVISFVDFGKQDEQELCLAKAVYFEARGEALEGQLAVAEVVLNRAASGIYPATICEVVTQPAQFSFIRGGRFPEVNRDSSHWKTALAIADIARKGTARQIGSGVLWYHANYVAPSWGRRLTRVTQIGTHIFYS